MIQIFSNSLGQEELAAIQKVFESKWLGMGPECKAFEQELAAHFNTPEVLLLNNCTAAIFISLKALGIKSGDEVIISTTNFNAIPSAVLDTGAKPVFADVDPRSLNILPSEISRLKTKKTKAVFILHYGGHPAPFDDIKAACGNNVFILEDSANAVASDYKGHKCGTLGDAGMFSFDAMKTLVMGDGGALIMKDTEALKKAKSLRYLGFAATTTSGASAMQHGNSRWWEFTIENVSGRFISNDILASIGRVQLRKLSAIIQRRKDIWTRYQRELANLDGLILPPEPLPNCSSSYYFYWVQTQKRDLLANYLKDKQIYTTFRYYPLHFVKLFGSNERLKNAENANETVLNIPLHQNLTDDDVSKVIEALKAFFKK